MNMFKPTAAKTPEEYIAAIDEPRRSQIQQLHDFIQKTVPKLKPVIIYGMIGYGLYPYKSKSGREGEWTTMALASQKNYISVYVSCADKDGIYIAEKYKTQLPKANIGKSCIRFKKVEDIDLAVLKKILLEGEKTPPISS